MNLPLMPSRSGSSHIRFCHDDPACVIERRPWCWLDWVGAVGLSPYQVRGSLAGLLVSAVTLPVAAIPLNAVKAAELFNSAVPLPGALAGPGASRSKAAPTSQQVKATGLIASGQPGPGVQSAPQGGPPQAGASLFLSLRRSAGGVDMVIEGTGATPVLQQGFNGTSWVGQLTTSSPAALRYGSQKLSLPEAGIQSISLQGSGSSYQVQVVPLPGLPLARPVIGADGRNLVISFSTVSQLTTQTARPDLRTPGKVPQPTYAPALQPRAVAPPLGDMAVGTMVLRNRGFINLRGEPVSMTVRNAPAREVLMALAERGGYGFVFVNGTDKDGKPLDAASTQGAPVSISFHGEKYSRAFNSVLLSAGLQARLEGNLIVVGPNVLGQSFGNQLSKVYRLNQASAGSAADYLASLGASITKVTVITNATTTGTSQGNQVAGGDTTTQTETQRITTTETYGATTGPLRGLTGTTDSRLQTITLVGDPMVIAVAENYLRQLDLRQRQVALSVRILDISLGNDSTLSNSFAFRYGNNFIVNDNGRLIGAWGDNLPPTLGQFNALSGGTSTAKPVVTTLSDGQSQVITPALNPAPVNPGAAYEPGAFYNLLNAAITSSSTKLLASPTLILTDSAESIGARVSNEASVTVGTQVITNYTVSTGTAGNGNSCQPQFGTSGLVFDAKVSKIDDNGFVTFSISPSVSTSTGLQNVVGCGPINILSQRLLKSGAVRVRDGQTLILTGVISDFNSQTSTKWPILGDLPLIGQFFRSSGGSRSKNELVIMVSPRIINDTDGGSFGYGYQPVNPESRQLMGAN